MVVLTLIVNTTTGRMEIAQLRLLPVETFPRKIGEWQAGKDREIEEDIRNVMPSAKIIDRSYTNDTGQQVQLLLLSATETGDFHNPHTCFPSQGWNLGNFREIRVNGQTIKAMTAEQDAERVNVLYWRTGYYEPPLPRNPLLRALYGLRVRLIGKEEGMSLFVRVIAPDSERSNRALMDFVEKIQAPLQVLKASGNQTAQNVDRSRS